MSTSSLTDLRRIRLEKADALRALGLDPYPSKSGRTHFAGPILEKFDEHAGAEVTVGGRIVSWRKQGSLVFGHILDQTGRIQLFIRKQVVAPTDAASSALGFEHFSLLDLGDFVEARGKVMKTNSGEISIEVTQLRVLSKSIRPLPDKWSGLTDREAILRHRYLDTIQDPESHKRFLLIAKMTAAIRTFLNERGFVEFQTPIIQPQYGGGTAKPFRTHVNALDVDMYLAISHELYLKRLIVAGYDRVYTIGRYFRNEGIDRSHHPEFAMVETMAAYENYEFNMQLVEEMFRHVALTVFSRTVFKVRGHDVDLALPWRRAAMADLVLEATGINFREITDLAEAQKRVADLGVEEVPQSIGHAMVAAFEAKAEHGLIQPTLVHGQPVEISPLAKPLASDPRFAERFEIYIGGMECGDNWSEQNDPAKLLEVWKKAFSAIEAEGGKVHPMDYDFIEALEHGMPPTTGIGPGLERMAMIFTEQENIDDVIFFPMMRPSVSANNAEIYGLKATAAAGEQPKPA